MSRTQNTRQRPRPRPVRQHGVTAEGDNAPASGRLSLPTAAGVPLPGVQSHPTFTQAPSHNAVTAEEHALQAPVSSITNVARDSQISSMQA
jgi:hypothetical protein